MTFILIAVAFLSFLGGALFCSGYYVNRMNELIESFREFDKKKSEAIEEAVAELLESIGIENIEEVNFNEE